MIKRTKSLLNSIKYSFKITFKSSPRCFFVRLFVQLANGIMPLLFAYLNRNLINVLADSLINRSAAGLIKEFIILSVIVLALGIARSTIAKIGEYHSQIHRDLISKYIELQIANKSASLDISYFDSSDLYDELQNVRRDSMALSMLTNHIFDCIRITVQLVSAFIVMITFNYLITLGLAILYIPSAIISRKQAKIMYDWTRSKVKERRKMSYSIGLLSNAMTAKELRLYDYKDDMIEKYNGIWGNWFNEHKKILRKRLSLTHISSLIPAAAIAGVSVFIGVGVINGELQVGDFSLYGSMTAQLAAAVSGIIGVLVSIYESNIKIEFFNKFMKWENRLNFNGELVVGPNPEIQFKNVFFKYPNMNNYVIENLSFTIKKNEKLALVGVNGAGKTTIIKLLLRLYDPVAGEILVDGIPLKEYDLKEYRKRFSVMFQRFGSYSLTVKESIGLADRNLDEEQSEGKLHDALAFSGVDKILKKHNRDKDAYLTRLFHNEGMELSGGEWQKVALARLFYRKSDIYILDEPSASLDPESEKEIFDKILDVCKDKTTILISHRLSNVTMADKILVIEDGDVIEQGSHRELIAQKGKYAYLFSLQSQKYLDNC